MLRPSLHEYPVETLYLNEEAFSNPFIHEDGRTVFRKAYPEVWGNVVGLYEWLAVFTWNDGDDPPTPRRLMAASGFLIRDS